VTKFDRKHNLQIYTDRLTHVQLANIIAAFPAICHALG